MWSMKKKLFAFMLAVCMLVATMTVPAGASQTVAESANQDVVNACSGVLRVMTTISIEDIGLCSWVGSGFLIGEAGSSQTVITNYHVVHPDPTELLAAMNIPVESIPALLKEMKTTVEIVINRDVSLKATVVNESSSNDYCILTLEQPLYDRTPLALGKSSELTSTQQVYAIGFPQAVSGFQPNTYYSEDDMVVADGRVNVLTEVKVNNSDSTTDCIIHSAMTSGGNSGGPLVDEKGNVVGLNESVFVSPQYGSNYSCSVQIDLIRKTLDSLGIKYISADPSGTTNETTTQTPETTGEPVEETAAPEIDKSALEAKVEEAKAIDGSKYTKESMGALETALENAESSLEDDAVSQAVIDKRLTELNSAIEKLEEPKGMNITLIIIIAAIVVVLVILTVVLIIVSRKGKKKAVKVPPMPDGMGMQNTPNSSFGNGPAPRPINTPPVGGYGSDDGSGETSVLGQGTDVTTVLGSSGGGSSAYLIRMKTGEKILLNSPNFTIGKEKRRVNYCISDNSSISRCHARIARKGAQYYIVDMNSTNFTFVNGTKAAANMEVPLSDNARIKLSDEDFEFHIG